MSFSKQTNLPGKLIFLFGGVFIVLFLSGWVNVADNVSAEQPNTVAVDALTGEVNRLLPPAAPPSGEGDEEEDGAEESPPEPVNVIKNGDFEKPWQPLNGVAPDWSPYSNGQAFFGWYDEQWVEAVRNGKHAQLLEIDEVEGNILDRVVAIYQTVEVAPNSEYELTIHAIMRSDAAEVNRNQFEFEMNWGVDKYGEGNYNNVDEWVYMPLTEQLRIGSNGEFPDDKPLFYERITDTITTGPDTNRITLFIRGLKKCPTGTEVNFNIDDVTLAGPPPGAPPADETSDEETMEEEPMEPAADSESDLPKTGATFSSNVSVGAFALGSFVLVILGTTATFRLLDHKKKP